MIEAILCVIVVLLIAINKNLVSLKNESRKWLKEISENILFKDSEN